MSIFKPKDNKESKNETKQNKIDRDFIRAEAQDMAYLAKNAVTYLNGVVSKLEEIVNRTT